jgi:hypothetical protein
VAGKVVSMEMRISPTASKANAAYFLTQSQAEELVGVAE